MACRRPASKMSSVALRAERPEQPWQAEQVRQRRALRGRPSRSDRSSGRTPPARCRSARSASAIWRSAAAMSGRRSSSAEGTATGTCGGAPASSRRSMVTSAGGRPVRIAMACSYWARATPRSVSCARAVLNWASACATSAPLATPAVSRILVSFRYSSYDATVFSSRSMSPSRP